MLDFTIWFQQGKSHSSRTYLWNTFTGGLFSTLTSLILLKTHGNELLVSFILNTARKDCFLGQKKNELKTLWACCALSWLSLEPQMSWGQRHWPKNLSSGCAWAGHWESDTNTGDQEIRVWTRKSGFGWRNQCLVVFSLWAWIWKGSG